MTAPLEAAGLPDDESGDVTLRQARARLAALAEHPVEQHAEVYALVDRVLREALQSPVRARR